MKQKGRNDRYPRTIQTWRKGEVVPEWLSDIAKIAGLVGKSGNPSLDVIPITSGGYQIRDSSGTGILISVSNERDYVCRGDDGKLFTLSPTQLKLLYI